MNSNPYDKLLDQIAQILQFAYDNAHIPLSEERMKAAEKQLDELKKKFDEFSKINDKFLEESGLTDYSFKAMLEDERASKTPPEKSVLLRAEILKDAANAASQDLLKASTDAKAEGKRLDSKQKKDEKPKSPQARKSKFRSMGSNKKWKPL